MAPVKTSMRAPRKAPKKSSRTVKVQRKVASFKEVAVTGWKSISERTVVELRGLTILAGVNSSGKSSFMQPLLMLKQTLEAPYDSGPLLLDGPHVRFAEASQFLSKSTSHLKTLSLDIEVDDERIEVVYGKSGKKPFEILSNRLKSDSHDVAFSLRSTQAELRKQLNDDDKEMLRDLGGKPYLSVYRKRCFLGLEFEVRKEKTSSLTLQLRGFEDGRIINALVSIIHLPGLRGNPERTYPINTANRTYSGGFQNYTASVIQRWVDTKSPELDQLNQSLSRLRLASEVATKVIDETKVELQVSRLLTRSKNDFVGLPDVGLAVSQVLPLLVALLEALPGQLVFVEQPELHLHPRAQVELAYLIVEAVNRGVQVVMETHSTLLILGIQTAAAQKKIQPSDVVLHWFQRNSKGTTQVTKAFLDKTGAFGDWPEDFGDVSLEAESAYLDAAEKSLTGR